MPYVGNQPTSVAFLTDLFNGTGSQTAFTLSAAPANTSSILVAVSGVLQSPDTYSVNATTLTFSAAPPSGTGNISVRFLGIPASGVVTTAYRTQTEFTATAGQTTFSVPSYTPGFIDVYRNGVLLASTNFTATNGTTVVLANAASVGDLIETVSFSVSSVLNAIPAVAGAVNSTYLLNGAVTKAKMAASGAWAPTGTVIQVVNATYSVSTFSTTNTYVDTGLTATITPTSSTSKILVCAQQNGLAKVTSANAYVGVQLQRNGTGIALFANSTGYNNTTSPNYVGGAGLEFLDSPATTSAVTYKTQFRSTGNFATAYVQVDGEMSTITLMEIAA